MAVARFAPFEADLASGELRKAGRAVPLPPQAFAVLAALVACPGTLVTRDELRRKLWPADIFVDHEHALNKAVSKLREVLGDRDGRSRFIETLSRRGYRFIASVQRLDDPVPGTVVRLLCDGRTISVGPGTYIVGRDGAATIRVDSSTVSRSHARLVVTELSVAIEDLDSKNGTRVNGRRIERLTELTDSDTIRVGAITLTFRDAGSASTETMHGAAEPSGVNAARRPDTDRTETAGRHTRSSGRRT